MSEFYVHQLIPPLGVTAVSIAPGTSRTFSRKVKVHRRGQVKITFNTVIQPVGTQILIDVLRNEKSIIHNAQTLFSTAATTGFKVPTFVMVDSCVGKGKYKYTVKLTNTSTSNPLIIESYSLVINSLNGESKRFFVKQDFPPTGTPALTIDGNSQQTINLPVKSCHSHKIKLEAALNVIVGTETVPDILVDIQRNGVSLTDGPQIFINTNPPLSLPVDEEISLVQNVLDQDSGKNPIYSLSDNQWLLGSI